MVSVESALEQYVEAARHRMVRLQGPGESSWRQIVDRGLAEAYSSGDLSGLTRVVQFLLHLLESQGRFEEAELEIDLAMGVAAGDRAALASLSALKATVLSARGRATEAVECANAAIEGADGLTHSARLKTLVLAESVRLQTLQPVNGSTHRLLGELLAAQQTFDQMFLLSWLIPYRAAMGEKESARPLVRAFRALARAQEASFREADYIVFRRWLGLALGETLRVDDAGSTEGNPTADWRKWCLNVWQAVGRRNWTDARFGYEALRRARAELGADHGSPENWSVMMQAASGEAASQFPEPPPAVSLTLANLASALAGAYAVALGGDRAQAATWLEWTTKVRRRGIESSLELPVSLRRVQGLLALRSGKPALARRELERAAQPVRESNRAPECMLAAIQAEELKVKLGRPDDAARAAALSRAAEAGIDPLPHLYVVHNAWDAATAQPGRPILTLRELDVLRQAALGHSYKHAANELGITWKTVQTLSHRVYDKLSVSSRFEAIEEARRLGLIDSPTGELTAPN
jgi:ATP/maltotriose-dependent transcriptional regulator MalT